MCVCALVFTYMTVVAAVGIYIVIHFCDCFRADFDCICILLYYKLVVDVIYARPSGRTVTAAAAVGPGKIVFVLI